jgi:hypothetical protein
VNVGRQDLDSARISCSLYESATRFENHSQQCPRSNLDPYLNSQTSTPTSQTTHIPSLSANPETRPCEVSVRFRTEQQIELATCWNDRGMRFPGHRIIDELMSFSTLTGGRWQPSATDPNTWNLSLQLALPPSEQTRSNGFVVASQHMAPLTLQLRARSSPRTARERVHVPGMYVIAYPQVGFILTSKVYPSLWRWFSRPTNPALELDPSMSMRWMT